MARVQVNLSDDMADRLVVLSEETGAPVAELIRRAINRWLDRVTVPSKTGAEDVQESPTIAPVATGTFPEPSALSPEVKPLRRPNRTAPIKMCQRCQRVGRVKDCPQCAEMK